MEEEGYQQKDNVVGKHRELNLGGKKIVELLTAYSTRVRSLVDAFTLMDDDG